MVFILEMPATCAVCGKILNTVGEAADHINDTTQNIQEDELSDRENWPDVFNNERDLQNYMEVERGFRHAKFRDRNGNLIPMQDELIISVTTQAGSPECIECYKKFKNNYRLFEHLIETEHGKNHAFGLNDARKQMNRYNEIESKYF